jgi:hypothetical protein
MKKFMAVRTVISEPKVLKELDIKSFEREL